MIILTGNLKHGHIDLRNIDVFTVEIEIIRE